MTYLDGHTYENKCRACVEQEAAMRKIFTVHNTEFTQKGILFSTLFVACADRKPPFWAVPGVTE